MALDVFNISNWDFSKDVATSERDWTFGAWKT